MTFSALMLLAPLLAMGDTLSGRVVGRDGHAVAGATVVVDERGRVDHARSHAGADVRVGRAGHRDGNPRSARCFLVTAPDRGAFRGPTAPRAERSEEHT